MSFIVIFYVIASESPCVVRAQFRLKTLVSIAYAGSCFTHKFSIADGNQ